MTCWPTRNRARTYAATGLGWRNRWHRRPCRDKGYMRADERRMTRQDRRWARRCVGRCRRRPLRGATTAVDLDAFRRLHTSYHARQRRRHR